MHICTRTHFLFQIQILNSSSSHFFLHVIVVEKDNTIILHSKNNRTSAAWRETHRNYRDISESEATPSQVS